MPGPASDPFDPEFGTAIDAEQVRLAVHAQLDMLTEILGARTLNIVGVVRGPRGPVHGLRLTERQLRIIRFALNRALDTL
jgi:hypothetical protein